MKKRSRRAVWLAAGMLAIAACGYAAVRWLRPPRPNILVVVVDSLRADRLGAYGSTRGVTPFLDALAAESVVYERAYSASSWTVPTVASIFLGRYPTQHGVVRFYAAIPEEATTLAEVLAAHGYATAGFTANAAISPASGFGHGFDVYELLGEPTFLDPKSDGQLINDAVLRRVDAVGPETPQFLYLHYMEPHSPYEAHDWTPPRAADVKRDDHQLNVNAMSGGNAKTEKVRERLWDFTAAEIGRLEQLYDGEVHAADRLLAELFAALAERGFLDDAIVIVTADHGEEFGEHGAFNHGVSLHEAAIRVPLLVHAPGTPPGRVPDSVEIAGLGPRLLGELRIDAPAGFTVPALPGAPGAAPATARSELVDTEQYTLWLHRYAIMRGTAKLLVSSEGEASEYELANQAEQRRAASVRPELQAALDDFLAQLGSGQAVAAQAELDPATVERLRGLGYAPSE